MKPAAFIDTGYVLALLNAADEHHECAAAASRRCTPPYVTTEAVLTEIGNALRRNPWRALGYAAIRDLRSDPNIEVVTVDAALFQRSLPLCGARMDKEWGLTDDISFAVMQDRGIAEALTADRHFEQAGFTNVLT